MHNGDQYIHVEVNTKLTLVVTLTSYTDRTMYVLTEKQAFDILTADALKVLSELTSP